MTATPVVAARGSVVIWEVRRIIATSLPQVVLFPLINHLLREKRLIDLILFTVSGDSGQTVPGSYGSANDWPGVHSLPWCLGLHPTGGAVDASLSAIAQPVILAFKAKREQLGGSYHTCWGGEDDIHLPVDGHSSVRGDAVQGQMPSSGSRPRVHAALLATGTFQCGLYEPLCVAGCGRGAREPAGGNPPHVHSCLRGEWILTSCRGASRPFGCIHHGGTG